MEVVNPFIEMSLEDIVVLEANELDNDIPSHIRAHLESRVGRCIKPGYIARILEVCSFKDPIIRAEDLNARVEFAVSYRAIVCCPDEGDVLVAQVRKVSNMMVTTSNGPILAITQFSRVNPE